MNLCYLFSPCIYAYTIILHHSILVTPLLLYINIFLSLSLSLSLIPSVFFYNYSTLLYTHVRDSAYQEAPFNAGGYVEG